MLRLVTWVDVDDQGQDEVAVTARHELELEDGRRVVLLGDRGWASSSTWADTTAEDVRETSRVVVGPDEAFGVHSQADMERDHWAVLQEVARRQDVVVDAAELRRLRHDVVLSPAVLARLDPRAGTPASG